MKEKLNLDKILAFIELNTRAIDNLGGSIAPQHLGPQTYEFISMYTSRIGS